jgi:membrane carboxypeptidase/penicillin-binding protein PbpC
MVDRETGCRLCRRCAAGREHTVEVVESWPVELAAWLRQHGRGQGLAPPHLPTCPGSAEEEAPPRILSPAADQTYVLLGEAEGARQSLLLKAASRARTLYWFVDGTLHATCEPMVHAFWPLESGAHTIVCSDEAGRSTSVAIEVR